MEMEAADIDTMPAGRDTDGGIRENKLAAVSSRAGISLRFRTHQVTGLFLIGAYLNENPRIQRTPIRGREEKYPLNQKLSLAEILAAALS
jgi:hypothetical protein